jgi:hypothetical protein
MIGVMTYQHPYELEEQVIVEVTNLDEQHYYHEIDMVAAPRYEDDHIEVANMDGNHVEVVL